MVYNVEGFCDKNKDLLFKDLIGLAECTSSTFFAVRADLLLFLTIFLSFSEFPF